MSNTIYLDYAATTPVDHAVAELMSQYLTIDGCFANPASRSHMSGWQAEAAVEKARKQVAGLLNADVREIVWTSGATESNNLAIKGYMARYLSDGAHVITSATEHKAVLDCMGFLEGRGVSVSYLEPGSGGRITREAVAQAIRPDTRMISVMHVNNETGVINDIEGIAGLAAENGIVMHVDAAQSAGKLMLDLQKLSVDLLSVCAHKIYGPKGVGALFVRRKPGLALEPLIHGGGHERGMRSGTLPTHQIVGMGASFELAKERMSEDFDALSKLRLAFLEALGDLQGMSVNGNQECAVPGIVNLAFQGVDGQTLLSALPTLAVSSGSACTSATMSPSHVLKAMGLDDELALSSLRISFGRYTLEQDVMKAAELIRHSVLAIRA